MMRLRRVLAAAVFVWLLRRQQRRLVRNAELLQLKGQVRSIFITGAASGIGLATARRFAREGWFVGMYDVNEAALQAAADSVRTIKGCAGVASGRLDLLDAASCESALAHFLSHSSGGRMDVLFNCAGLLQVGFFEDLDLNKQLAQMRVNVDGLIMMTYFSLGALKRTPHSRVVNMSSVAQSHGMASMAVYCASKHAVRALTEAWGCEFARHGIAVTDVAAQFVATPMVFEQERKEFGLITQTGMFLSPEAVADAVFAAATDDPSIMHFTASWLAWFIMQFFDFERLCNFGFLRRAVSKLTTPENMAPASKI